jgi:cellulose synthase/poly-beta-1,6-N-acetylglucosamine synthase-like glycosyltransferase
VNAAAWIFCFCLAWVLWVIAGYPLWLALRAHFWSRPPRSGPFAPAITAVIPVHNGVEFLSAKLESVLGSDYPPDKLNILILSDGSDDGTDDLAADFASQFPDRIRLLRLARAGKAATLNVAFAEARSDVLLLTDVRQRLDPSCVRFLAETLHDPQVGVVSGNLLILPGESVEETSVGLYWRYESWIRRNLSLTDSLLGATGPIYAIRRTLAHSLPEGCLLDDVWLPMQAVLSGYRSVWNEHAVAWDCPTGLQAEFIRKVRTQAGVFQLLWQLPGLFSSRNRVRWPFCVLKLGRLLMPEILLLCLFLSFWLPAPLREFIVAAQLLFYAVAVLDVFVPEAGHLKRVTGPLRAFFVLLAAALSAVAIFFTRPEKLWKQSRVRAPRHKPPAP